MFQSSQPFRFTAGHLGMGGIKIKPHGAHGLVCTREIQDIRTPKGHYKATPHKHTNFCISEHFFKSLSKEKVSVIVSYLFLNRSTGRNSAKSVCLHLANWVLIIKLFQRVLEAGADLMGKGWDQLQGRVTPAPGWSHISFNWRLKNREGTCYHLKCFLSKQAFS